MKKNLLKSALVLFVVLCAITGLLALVGCDDDNDDDNITGLLDLTGDDEEIDDHILGTPANVTITVVERTMTVSWGAVNNAQGYEIYTTSVGCGSGNKIINTKDNTATNLTGTGSYIKDDKSNGAVEIKSTTSIQITLMPATGDNTKPMASKVTAKVKALGGEAGGTNYLDSEYSAVVEKTLGGMGGM
jgi:hypothetical protein